MGGLLVTVTEVLTLATKPEVSQLVNRASLGLGPGCVGLAVGICYECMSGVRASVVGKAAAAAGAVLGTTQRGIGCLSKFRANRLGKVGQAGSSRGRCVLGRRRSR